MSIVKAYLKKVVAHLKEKGKEERVPEFQKGATEMIKFIVGKYDEMQIFTGQSYDTEAGLAFSYTKDGETEPVFLFFVDGMREEKFWRGFSKQILSCLMKIKAQIQVNKVFMWNCVSSLNN